MLCCILPHPHVRVCFRNNPLHFECPLLYNGLIQTQGKRSPFYTVRVKGDHVSGHNDVQGLCVIDMLYEIVTDFISICFKRVVCSVFTRQIRFLVCLYRHSYCIEMPFSRPNLVIFTQVLFGLPGPRSNVLGHNPKDDVLVIVFK